jgi:hypothetical protein
MHGRRIILQGGYVFDVEHQHTEHLDVLQKRAFAYPRLVEAVLDLLDEPYSCDRQAYHALLRELGER